MPARHRRFLIHVLRSLEEKDQRHAAQRQDAEDEKIIHVRPKARLLGEQRTAAAAISQKDVTKAMTQNGRAFATWLTNRA